MFYILILALFRRGSAYFHKKKYRDAKKDLEIVMNKEPNNKNAKELLLKVDGELKKEEDEKMEVKSKGGKRLVIEETDGETEDEEEEEEVKVEAKIESAPPVTVTEPRATTTKTEEKSNEKKKIEIKETEEDDDEEETNDVEMKREEEVVQPTPPPPPPAQPEPPKPEVQLPQQVVDFKNEANKLFQNGHYGDAIDYYSKAINQIQAASTHDVYSNTLSILYSNRASCKQKIGNYKDAINDCDLSLSLYKDNSKVIYKKAYSLELIEKYGDSLHEYEKIMRLDSTHKQAQEGYNRVKSLLIQRGHYNKPKKSESTAAPSSQENYEQLKTKGNEFVKINRYTEALECYTKCINVDAKNPIAYLNRSLCYIKLDKPQLAIEDCDYVLSVEKANVKALYRRALAYKVLKVNEKAISDLESVIKIEPNNTIAIRELQALKEQIKSEVKQMAKKIETIATSTTAENAKKSEPAPAPVPPKPKEKQPEPPAPTQHKPRQYQLPAKITNSFEFLQAWNSINPNDIQTFCLLLELIDSSQLSSFIGTKLDDSMISKFIAAFHHYLCLDLDDHETEDGYNIIKKRKHDRLIVFSYLQQLAKAKRFDFVKSFLNEESKQLVKQMFDYLEEQLKSHKTNEFYNASNLEALKKSYSN